MNTPAVLITLVCAAAVILLSSKASGQDDRPPETETVGPYDVKWSGLNTSLGHGDTIRIYRKGAVKPSCVYTDDTVVDVVSAWSVIQRDQSKIRDVLIKSNFFFGMDSEVTILADFHSSFRMVFQGYCWAGLEPPEPPLQWVHLDNDIRPEILMPARSEQSEESGNSTDRAVVWKWSIRLEKYVRMRVTTWKERFKPLLPHPTIRSSGSGKDDMELDLPPDSDRTYSLRNHE